MTSCPKCDDIWLYRLENGYWKLNCKCGHAWNWSSACRTKREVKENWERLMDEWDRNQKKEPKR